MGDKKKGEYKTGFFNKLIGKDPFYTKGIQMADTEYKLQKKYSNPVRKVKTN